MSGWSALCTSTCCETLMALAMVYFFHVEISSLLHVDMSAKNDWSVELEVVYCKYISAFHFVMLSNALKGYVVISINWRLPVLPRFKQVV